MKVRVLSDLHLEFGDFHPGTGDVLVLAGDICVASEYKRYHQFFEDCVAGYNKVFYCMGNHESYNGNLKYTEKILREKLPEGITLLQNQSEFYNGWHFVGSTLWAGFEGANEVVMSNCEQGMNDYHVIYNGLDRLTPNDTLSEHMESVDWFTKCVPTLRGPVFMMTHHAPSMKSVDNNYRSEDVKGAYASNLERFITANNNIKVWCHGHIHESHSYSVGDCHIISNPRGYYGCEENIGFDSESEIDLAQYHV